MVCSNAINSVHKCVEEIKKFKVMIYARLIFAYIDTFIQYTGVDINAGPGVNGRNSWPGPVVFHKISFLWGEEINKQRGNKKT